MMKMGHIYSAPSRKPIASALASATFGLDMESAAPGLGSARPVDRTEDQHIKRIEPGKKAEPKPDVYYFLPKPIHCEVNGGDGSLRRQGEQVEQGGLVKINKKNKKNGRGSLFWFYEFKFLITFTAVLSTFPHSLETGLNHLLRLLHS